ncbi:MAG TPA: hypothetical protein VJT83_03835 [Chitinophagaceae bacterium]|nr:hypothetical protein [Chitinophagaceae bacterium]
MYTGIVRWFSLGFLLLCILSSLSSFAQTDTARQQRMDSFIRKQRGIIGQLAENLLTDPEDPEPVKGVLRNDQQYQRFRGRVIRNIYVVTLNFGVSITDTSQKAESRLTHLANRFHRKSRDFAIRNNLFFQENEKLNPYLLGDNERHLRNLPYLQDARFQVRGVSRDSVDIIVFTKDVLSLGGSVELHNTKSISLTPKEDNFMGWGDRLQLQLLYDQKRVNPVGYGTEYIRRNIGGSFIDGSIGYVNFLKSFSSGKKEENTAYLRFERPLVNPYMRWTYAAEAALHSTQNMYASDSLYTQDLQYRYTIMDAWLGWNMSADKLAGKNEADRLRRLLGLRVLSQKFNVKPVKFKEVYNYRYADLTAVLMSATIFRQDFYKTQYIYGFGRNEDVPEGIDISLSGGWTKKESRVRPYVGLDFQRYYFSKSERYWHYTARVGTYFYKRRAEDIDLLFNIDYFSHLIDLGRKWKQRTFISGGFARQFRVLLNEPLMLESEYGLPGFRYNNQGGDLRISGKVETVFFSPWSILLFRFAPFIFADATYFKLIPDGILKTKTFSAIGGGIRTRNESLIFGTIELKGMYFPKKNFFGDQWRIETNLNVRFKYNSQLIRRPEFVRVN